MVKFVGLDFVYGIDCCQEDGCYQVELDYWLDMYDGQVCQFVEMNVDGGNDIDYDIVCCGVEDEIDCQFQW